MKRTHYVDFVRWARVQEQKALAATASSKEDDHETVTTLAAPKIFVVSSDMDMDQENETEGYFRNTRRAGTEAQRQLSFARVVANQVKDIGNYEYILDEDDQATLRMHTVIWKAALAAPHRRLEKRLHTIPVGATTDLRETISKWELLVRVLRACFCRKPIGGSQLALDYTTADSMERFHAAEAEVMAEKSLPQIHKKTHERRRKLFGPDFKPRDVAGIFDWAKYLPHSHIFHPHGQQGDGEESPKVAGSSTYIHPDEIE